MPDTSPRFDKVSIALHWCIGLGIIAISAAEMLRGELPKGNAFREGLKFLHNPAGTVIFGLVLVRIAWRMMYPAPRMPAGMRMWEKAAAKLTHIALYAMMIAIPLLGIVYTLARGRPSRRFVPIALQAAAASMARNIVVIGGGPAAVLLGQPARQPLHHRLDFRRIGFRARLPNSGSPNTRFYPPSTKPGT